jgi:hypothetical protein
VRARCPQEKCPHYLVVVEDAHHIPPEILDTFVKYIKTGGQSAKDHRGGIFIFTSNTASNAIQAKLWHLINPEGHKAVSREDLVADPDYLREFESAIRKAIDRSDAGSA